jgi:antitoxin (DNA-binding transcriptional repressor) of toxin-antitoxin stability system
LSRQRTQSISPVAEAASDFASLVVRVCVESVEFVIEEQGRPVAVLSPVEPRTQE